MRVFKTKQFACFARRQQIADASLIEAVQRAEHGLLDAELGGVVKQRVARPGQGRSGGYRVLLAYRRKARAVFLSDSPKANGAISTMTSWRPFVTSPRVGLRRTTKRWQRPLPMA